MSTSIDLEIATHRQIGGRSVYWNDPVNEAYSDIDQTDGVELAMVYIHENPAAYKHYWRSRELMKFDLSGIPRNSYIESAKLRVKFKRYSSAFLPDSFTLAIYPNETRAWDTAATMRYYDGTNEWDVYGMKPNVDYYAISALASLAIARAEYTDGDLIEFDLKSFIQDCIDRDDMAALLVLKPEDTYEQTSMEGSEHFTGQPQGYQVSFYGKGESVPQDRPILRVVYKEPIAFFASQENGSIDESREIFLGAGKIRIGTVVQDPNATSYQEVPFKTWVKNMLTDMSMRAVEVCSPPNWATLPEADEGNTGNGTCSDVTTSPTDTIDEQWYVEFTSATAFDVYRDSGTGDDPAQSQTWTQDGSGTVGTQYSSATRGIAFTITAGGTAFASGDKFYFRTYKDYSIVGAPTDSDYLLEICKDSGGSPDGNWYYARTAMTTLTQQVVSSNLLYVANAKYFNPSNKIRILDRATGQWSSWYTIQSVNKTANTITLTENISAEVGDWVHAQRINMGDMVGEQAVPFWLRGVSFTDTAKEEKYQYLRGQETI